MEQRLTHEQFLALGKIFLHPESVGEIRDQKLYDSLIASGCLEAHESGIAIQYRITDQGKQAYTSRFKKR